MTALVSRVIRSIKPRHSEDWLKFGLTLWVGLAVAVTAKTLIEGDRHSVYQVFASASQHWWADRSLYDLYQGIDLYRYSPTFAVAFAGHAAFVLQQAGPNDNRNGRNLRIRFRLRGGAKL